MPIVLKPKGAPRSGWKWLIGPADCPEAVRPSTVRLEVVARGGLIGGPNGPPRSSWNGRSRVVDQIGLLDQSADCPEAEARHGQTGSGLSRWFIGVVDGSGLLDQPADCPEAEARHGQTRSGLSRWFIGVVDGSGLLDQSADCPEAEARHGQTGSGLIEANQTARHGQAGIVARGWLIKLDYLTSLPIVLKPKPATVRLEVVDRSGLKWLVEAVG
ncbi:hypothetical protein N7524_006318 [Penicillium chrysogenum]|nr:hypothetical protein N7524_006318 [Penicillium chrysogenum]